MTEQQQHLKDLIEKRFNLQKELELLQFEVTSKKELFLKTQGIIEYLTQIGVRLPEKTEEFNQNSENESV